MQPTDSTRAHGRDPDREGRPVVGLGLRCPTCARKLRDVRLRIADRLALRRTCSIGHRWCVTVEPTDIRPDRALHRIEWLPRAA
jgi:hypothetical protein